MSRPTATRSGLRLGSMPTIIAVAVILYVAQDVLIPLAVAVLLAFVLAPAVTALERCRVGRIAAVLIAVTMALGVLVIGWVVHANLWRLRRSCQTTDRTSRRNGISFRARPGAASQKRPRAWKRRSRAWRGRNLPPPRRSRGCRAAGAGLRQPPG